MKNNVSFDIISEGVNKRPICGSFGFSTSILLHDGNKHILFDTGSYGIRNKIKELIENNAISCLVLSHLHFDHCANIDLFKNIPIYVSKRELESLNENKDINTYKALEYFINIFDLQFLSDSMQISPNVKAFYTPGHTAGHFSLGFECEGKKIIAAGDAVKSALEYTSGELITKPFDIILHKKTIDLIKNNFDIIIPGHQAPFPIGNPIDKDVILTSF